MSNSNFKGVRVNPRSWVPHKGPFKLIKLKPNEGLTPPMNDADGHQKTHKEEW